MERSAGARLAHEHLDSLRTLIRHKVRRIVGRYGFRVADREDLENELFVDLIKRLDHFDPSVAKLKTFADRIVTKRIATLIQHACRQRRDYRRAKPLMDEAAQESCAPVGDNDLKHDLDAAVEKLPSELQVFWQHLLLSGVCELARATGRERGDMRGVLAKLRRRFSDAGLQIYLTNPPADAVSDK